MSRPTREEVRNAIDHIERGDEAGGTTLQTEWALRCLGGYLELDAENEAMRRSLLQENERLRERLKPAEYCASNHCDCDQSEMVRRNLAGRFP